MFYNALRDKMLGEVKGVDVENGKIFAAFIKNKFPGFFIVFVMKYFYGFAFYY